MHLLLLNASVYSVTILSLKYTGSRSKSILYEVLKQLRGQIWETHLKTVSGDFENTRRTNGYCNKQPMREDR